MQSNSHELQNQFSSQNLTEKKNEENLKINGKNLNNLKSFKKFANSKNIVKNNTDRINYYENSQNSHRVRSDVEWRRETPQRRPNNATNVFNLDKSDQIHRNFDRFDLNDNGKTTENEIFERNDENLVQKNVNNNQNERFQPKKEFNRQNKYFPQNNTKNYENNFNYFDKIHSQNSLVEISLPNENATKSENNGFNQNRNFQRYRNNGRFQSIQNGKESFMGQRNCENYQYNDQNINDNKWNQGRNNYKNVNIDYKSNKNVSTKFNKTTKKEANKIDLSKLDQREYLIHELNLNRYECMICMNVIEKRNTTWNCDNCYHIFHLKCITKWSESIDKKENPTEEILHWRCPTCQNNKLRSNTLYYTCFCKKEINPPFKYGSIAHSCGDVCGKNNETNMKCRHLCTLQCHPGPCPPCEASVTRNCHCERTHITAKCIADETQFRCQSICDKLLQCELHRCDKQCHVDDGHLCNAILKQNCWCGNSSRDILCGSKESRYLKYGCGAVCDRKKKCENHNCESLCHSGDCEECEQLPVKVKSCWCEKVTLQKLSIERATCLDPIPSCGNICEKLFKKCGHKCNQICHGGECKPCSGSMLTKCRCKSVQLTIDCAVDEVGQCKQRCKSKLLCGRHRCDQQCCDKEVHVCLLECGRMLSCTKHRCERECGHPGLCSSCPNVSFEELFCECGSTFTLPPIACNQKPPTCHLSCSRAHTCNHEVRHNCHTELTCPPCTELVKKVCPGEHREYINVPCFRPVATCGLLCGKPLPNCTHTCMKVCHSGNCVEDGEECKQSCQTLRTDCAHPCAALCHDGSCVNVMGRCNKELVLTCECTLRSSLIFCYKLESIKFLLKDNNGNTSADIVLSKDNKVFLVCDSDCKRAARNSKLAEAFNIEMPLSVLYTYYPDSVKEYGLNHKNYVVRIQNILINMYNSFANNTKITMTEIVSPVTYEESQFIQRYTSCFKMLSVLGTDKKNRQCVTIDARRGITQVPKPLLTEVLKEKYPHLFIEKVNDKVQVLTTTPGTMLSFADRLKLKK